MKKWFKLEEITVEDAFRVMDIDFDGQINKSDIEKFLIEVLHVIEKDITPLRISRLFKLMDQYKRGKILLLDIRRIFTEAPNSTQNFTVTGGRFIQGRDTYDWKTNAKQQIGIVLSRQFGTLNDSFDGNEPALPKPARTYIFPHIYPRALRPAPILISRQGPALPTRLRSPRGALCQSPSPLRAFGLFCIRANL